MSIMLIVRLLVVAFMAFFVGQMAITHIFLPVIFLSTLCVLGVFFAAPFIYFLISLCVLYNGFGIISLNIGIPGLFKLGDLLFTGMLFYAVWRFLIERKDGVRYRSCGLGGWVIVFSAFYLFEIIRTVIAYPTAGVVPTIQAYRHYWYYLFLFISLAYLNSWERIQRFIGLLVVVTNVLCVGLIIQVVTRKTVFYAMTSSIQVLSGSEINRVYPIFTPIVFFSFAYSFYKILLASKKQWPWVLSLFITFLGGFVMYARALWLQLFLIILLALFLPFKSKSRIVVKLVGMLFAVCIFFGLVSCLSSNKFAEKTVQHVSSTFKDLFNKTGTFDSRLKGSTFRFELIKQHPVLGAGLVHGRLTRTVFARELYTKPEDSETNLETVDSGLLSVFTLFGIAGVILFVVFIWVFYLHVRNILHYKDLGDDERCLVYAVAAYLFAGAGTFLTLGIFTNPQEIILLSILCGMLQFIRSRRMS